MMGEEYLERLDCLPEDMKSGSGDWEMTGDWDMSSDDWDKSGDWNMTGDDWDWEMSGDDWENSGEDMSMEDYECEISWIC